MLIDTDKKLSTLTGIYYHELLDSVIECINNSQLVPDCSSKILPVKKRVIIH